MQAFILRHGLQQCGLMQPPGLEHKAAHTVPVHGTPEFFLGYGKPYLQRRGAYCRQGCGRGMPAGRYQLINDSYGENRKRFPGKEKRVNMLLSLEPLIYFESITNGEGVLANYLRRRSSETVSL